MRKYMPSPVAKIRPKNYEADALRVEDLVGTLEVEVRSGPVEVVLEVPATSPALVRKTEGLPARGPPSAHGAEATAMMLA